LRPGLFFVARRPRRVRAKRKSARNAKNPSDVTAETASARLYDHDPQQQTTPTNAKETTVNKLLIAAAALALTALLGSGAQAGFNVRLSAPKDFSTVQKAGCGGGYGNSYRKRRYRSVSRRSSRKVYAARKPAKAVSVAKVEKVEKKAEVATAPVKSQNSSITTAEGQVATKSEPKKVAAVEDLGCKQFFPSVGMTLSVPCE
jgi:hypothetical protein